MAQYLKNTYAAHTSALQAKLLWCLAQATYYSQFMLDSGYAPKLLETIRQLAVSLK